MRPWLYLENFKGFEHAEFELAPVTLLLGANSTGKSSVIQAIKILAAQGNFLDSHLKLGATEGLVKLLLKDKDVILEEYRATIPSDSFSIDYYPPECVFHLSAVRFELPRQLKKFNEFSMRFGSHGENLYEFLVADALKNIATKEQRFNIIDRINAFLKEIKAEFTFAPKVDVISVEGGFPKAKFSIYVNDKGVEVNIVDAGFGYTQFLYVSSFILSAGEGLEDSRTPVFILLEEPAVHLNQKLVVELFDMILKAASLQKFMIIETHSEHIFMRLRRRVAEGKVKPEDVAIYFFKKEKTNTIAERVEINEYGELSETFPVDFFSQDYDDLVAITKSWSEKDGYHSN